MQINAVVGALGFIVGVVLFNQLFDYFDGRSSYHVNVSAKTIRDWYCLNPERYSLYLSKVKVYTSPSQTDYEILQPSNFIEYLKYRRFVKKIEQNARNAEVNKSHKNILDAVQKDIDVMRKKVQKDINQAEELMKGINL